MRITTADLAHPLVINLLQSHLLAARANTAPGSAHAVDLSAMQAADLHVWTVSIADEPVGVGAVKRLTADHGEIKSMFTAPAARSHGVGSSMLQHLIATARSWGMARLSLETGCAPYFQPARSLYRRHGFAECPPFAAYVPDANSVFMTRWL